MRCKKIMTIAVFFTLLTACAGLPPVAPEDPATKEAKAYYSARRALNGYWENYLNFRDVLPPGPQKVKLMEKFKDTGANSYFTQAKRALDAWGVSLGTDSAYGKKQLFDTLFQQVISLLLSENIIVIK